MQLVEVGALADGDVADAADRLGVVGQGGAQVGLHGVRDEAEVARVSPSPLVVQSTAPSSIAAIQRGITAAYAPFGSWRGPNTLK